MSDSKNFKRKYMHPTRRKLVDMIKTGEYDKNVVVGWTKENQIKREVGDIWEDEHNKYEQHTGYIMKSSKNSDTYKEIRDYVRKTHNCKNIECDTVKVTRIDTKLIKKSGYCLYCLSIIETKIRIDGLWEHYQNYKIWTRMLIDGKLRLEQIQQAHDEAKQVYEYMNEDGSVDKWEMPQNIDDVKAEMKTIIESGKKELEQLEEMRIDAFNKLKDKNYEHYL